MKYRYAFLYFLAAFLLQSTVLIHFRVLGIAPNLVLCLVARFSFLYEKPYGMVMGILFGLLLDLCFGPVIGVAALAFFLTGLTLSFLRGYLYQESAISMFFAALISTLVYEAVYFICLLVLGMGYQILYVLKYLPVLIVWHSLILIGIYFLTARRMEKYPNDRYV